MYQTIINFNRYAIECEYKAKNIATGLNTSVHTESIITTFFYFNLKLQKFSEIQCTLNY